MNEAGMGTQLCPQAQGPCLEKDSKGAAGSSWGDRKQLIHHVDPSIGFSKALEEHTVTAECLPMTQLFQRMNRLEG